MTIVSRPVVARAMRIASIVASEPEFTNRQRGRPKRAESSSATIDPVLGRRGEVRSQLDACLDRTTIAG